MAKIYDFQIEFKARQRRARMVDILETAMLMVKKNELDGIVVIGRAPQHAYPFARENFNDVELLDIVSKAKEKGL